MTPRMCTFVSMRIPLPCSRICCRAAPRNSSYVPACFFSVLALYGPFLSFLGPMPFVTLFPHHVAIVHRFLNSCLCRPLPPSWSLRVMGSLCAFSCCIHSFTQPHAVVHILSTQAVTLFATKRVSGLIVDCGYAETRVVPIVDLVPIPQRATVRPLGHVTVQNSLAHLLRVKPPSILSPPNHGCRWVFPLLFPGQSPFFRSGRGAVTSPVVAVVVCLCVPYVHYDCSVQLLSPPEMLTPPLWQSPGGVEGDEGNLPEEFPRRDVRARERVVTQRQAELQEQYQQEKEELAELSALPGELTNGLEDGELLSSQLEDMVVRSCFVDISRWRSFHSQKQALQEVLLSLLSSGGKSYLCVCVCVLLLLLLFLCFYAVV